MHIKNGFDTENLKVVYENPAVLNPYARNPRTHTNKQVKQIASSMKEFGFTNPILIDVDKGVLAGHGRLEAAKLMGADSVPTIQLGKMSEAQKRAYILADNKLAENAGWDPETLAIELQYLTEFNLDFDFDVAVTGFETAEIDILIGDLGDSTSTDPADETPDIEADTAPVSALGDLWFLGKHRLLCADATDRNSFDLLLDGKQAQMIFSDPPYNVRISGNVCGSGAVKHDEFAMASGEMSPDEFTAFLSSVLGHMAAYSQDGAIHFICMDWRHIDELTAAGCDVYAELKNLCVWAKTNGGMGSLYRSQHELVFVYKNGTAGSVRIYVFEAIVMKRKETSSWLLKRHYWTSFWRVVIRGNCLPKTVWLTS